MPASSTLVNTADTAELRLVQLLSKSLASSPDEKAAEIFIQDCETCIARADASALLHRILHDGHTTPLLSLVEPTITLTNTEASGAFALLAILLERVANKPEQVQLLHSLVSALESLVQLSLDSLVSSEEEVKVHETRSSANKVLQVKQRVLTMLCTLYNVRASHKDKCFLLSRIFTVAAITSSSHRNVQQEMILSLLPGRNTTLGTLLEYHNLVRLVEMELSSQTEEAEIPTAVDKRILYSTASQVLKQVVDISTSCPVVEDGQDLTASAAILEKERTIARVNQQRFLLKLLATYNKDTDMASLDTLALDMAKEAAIGLIVDPISLFHDQRGITSLIPIQALKLDSATKPLYELLEIFQTGKLEDFYVFLSSSPENKTALQSFGIEQETCIHHLRLLSLCSLAAEHEEIPYAAIASTLQIPMDQVEPWVISAVSSGIMSAKMDQLSHVVMVEQCVVRSFGMDEWKVLQTRLHGWKKNVGNILVALKQQQLQTNPSTTNIVQQYVSSQQGVSSA